ncbi:MAG: cupin domain-containing protein [Candidatus Eremiobacteraeota bacterium]|nr:cupin domain-containing protein [Candidatus Eremiobacteraeota bacterium]
MKRGLFAISAIAAVALAASATGATIASAASAAAPGAPTIVRAGSVAWQPVKGFSGVQMAVLWGDPTKSGQEYAVRYKFADGVKFPPHWHPKNEQVTVLSGVFIVGVGKTVDLSKTVALPAGSYVAIPATLPHYAMAKGETIVEVHGIGPDTINLIK